MGESAWWSGWAMSVAMCVACSGKEATIGVDDSGSETGAGGSGGGASSGGSGASSSGGSSGSSSGSSGSGASSGSGTNEGGSCVVCALYCPYGMVLGPDGCPRCQCNMAPDAGSSADASAGDAGSPCGVDAGVCCPFSLNQARCDPGLTCCQGIPYPTNGACLPACRLRSDYHIKRDFQPVRVDQVLEQVASMSMTTWRYEADAPNVRHMGPMAQEFHAAFGLGDSERSIHTVDGIGVSLAGIQALNAAVAELRAENRELRTQNAEIEEQLRTIRASIEGHRHGD
jgi:hypothetical protein